MKARLTASGCACLWPVLCLLLLHAVSNLVQAEEFGISTYTVTPQNTVTITKASNPTGAIVLPSSINGMPVTAIGIGAFPGSFNLTNLTLPDSITSIGYVAFSGCGSLTSVTLLGFFTSLTSIGHSTFKGCNRLTGLTLPASLTSIGNDAFYSCSSLARITFLGTAPSGNYLISPDYPLPPGYTTYWLSSKTGFTSPTGRVTLPS